MTDSGPHGPALEYTRVHNMLKKDPVHLATPARCYTRKIRFEDTPIIDFVPS